MADYAVEIDINNVNTSHTQLIDLVGGGRTVLDVGCWTGDLGRALIAQGCRVSGVELDAGAAAVAARDLERVVVSDLDREPLSRHFEPGTFDAIVLGDVLEHLMDPVGVLRDATSLLAPGGRFVISIPNVTHGSVRLALLQGHWDHTETGLLDRTHIKFFSIAGLRLMTRDAGLVIDDLRGTLADPLAVEVQVNEARLPPAVVEWVRDQPEALIYQFVLSARPVSPGEEVADAVMIPAARIEDVRLRDEHTRGAARELAKRREVLTVRDHIVGLEGTASSAEAKSARAAARAKRLREQLDKAQQRVRRQARRIDELQERIDGHESLSARRHVARSVARRFGRS